MKILVLEGDNNKYKDAFTSLGKPISNVSKLADCDLVVFTGGSDVDPYFYDDNKIDKTYSDKSRDFFELEVYNHCKILELPMVGICRGAQFLNVMNRGVLIQHVNNHNSCDHIIHTPDDKMLTVTGDHHQMIYPKGDYELLAWAKESTVFETGGKVKVKNFHSKLAGREPEVVFWPTTRCLGFQYHPEWMSESSEGFKFFIKTLKDKLL